MARTKSSVGAKVSAVKSSKARSIASSATRIKKTGSSSKRYRSRLSRGNPVCPRKTPDWQKPITHFFSAVDNSPESDSDCEVVYQFAAVIALKESRCPNESAFANQMGSLLQSLATGSNVMQSNESKSSQVSFNQEMERLDIGELNNNQIGGESSPNVVVKGKGKGKGKKSKLPSKSGSTHVENEWEVNKESENMSD